MIVVYFYGYMMFKSNMKKTIPKNIIIFIGLCIIHTIIFLFVKNAAKTILLCIIYTILIASLFGINIIRASLSSIIYAALTIIPDLLMTYIPIYVFKLKKEYFYNNFAGSILGNLCVSILTVIFIYLIRKPLSKVTNYKFSINKKIIIMSITTIIFIAFFFYKFANDFRLNKGVVFYLFAIFAFIAILFTLFKEKIENENILNKYDDLLSIMRDYESDVEEQRTILHETRNELKTVRSMVNDKNNKKQIIEYIDSVLEDKTGGNMKKYSKFKYLPSNGIKGFFYYKFMEAERLGINANVFVAKDIEKSFLKNLDIKTFKDLGRILGVYLDNAIEGSSTSDKKELGLEVYLKNNNIEMIISNTFNNDINLNEIGNTSFSTKSKNRGHGLLLVKRLLQDNERFITENNIIDNIYVQKLIIKGKTQ